MTTTPLHRTPLPITAVGYEQRASRSAMTCRNRCGDACFKPEPNRTDHGHVRDEIAKVVQRRALLKGAAATAGVGALVLGGGSLRPAAAAPLPAAPDAAALSKDMSKAAFRPVPPNTRDALVVAQGFTQDVVIRWGDAVLPGAPRFDPQAMSAEAARQQFGYNCDYVGVLPHPTKRAKSLLVVNHEYTSDDIMFPASYDDEAKKEISMYNHGMSVVEIKRGRVEGSWLRVQPRFASHNRRIHLDTEFEVTGPAAGTDRLKTSADASGRTVLGTLNNCAGGTTPWGTVLSGEENFNQYFGTEGTPNPEYAASYARYGLAASTSRGWYTVQDRFDLAKEPNEPFRFGWIVEVDPSDPQSTPRKHTMLGRFKHEGANIIVSKDGHAVAYMGDDERGDYLYKFVSKKKVATGTGANARRRNLSLLTEGTLYVARLEGNGYDATTNADCDGTGTWIPLASDTESFVEGMELADVLIDTRLAADRATTADGGGPTRMDRPEDVEPNLVTGRVYAALTNNSRRGTQFPVDEANPVGSSTTKDSGEPTVTPGNNNGYVLEMIATRGDHALDTFRWKLFLVCGDPEAQETYFGGFDKSQVSPISCPDNVAFDSVGNLWVSTDGNALGSNDGIFRVPTQGPERGHVQQFLSVPRGAEACGPLITADDKSLFVAVQHPGELDDASFENPGSTWPHTDDYPRPSVAVAYRRA
ncbi:PhoX family phosphatase [Nocardioides sp. CFH 31398]|uniref:PhoX family protein n=1 Tax=Nocardioides sp. CFH 31398 TaxID=2919579 RepID=UPI001F05DDBA|nr:PhoX family phosphatase [Nocardioides sp. CFH 31398]MCH1865196.1 PhoX family phosphatase [Nocardioides sp. CFH 31398]